MLIADMIHSCSNDKVAQAALSCIGGTFADRVASVASKNGVSAGRYVALVVKDFALRADGAAHAALQEQIARCDAPLLHGLRRILESALEGGVFLCDEALGMEPHLIGGASFASRSKYQ